MSSYFPCESASIHRNHIHRRRVSDAQSHQQVANRSTLQMKRRTHVAVSPRRMSAIVTACGPSNFLRSQGTANARDYRFSARTGIHSTEIPVESAVVLASRSERLRAEDTGSARAVSLTCPIRPTQWTTTPERGNSREERERKRGRAVVYLGIFTSAGSGRRD